jgi:deoxyribodipyrimidine photolyase
VLVDLARKVGASRVYCHTEVSYEEAAAEKRVAAALRAEDIQLKSCWGSTLFDADELPFKIEDVPPTHGEALPTIFPDEHASCSAPAMRQCADSSHQGSAATVPAANSKMCSITVCWPVSC